MFSFNFFSEKKRVIEVVLAFVVLILLLFLSQFGSSLFPLSDSLSKNREVLSTLSYFALININVLLILILSFLIFRNVTKLIVERKRGVLGSKLRTKLVFALVFFAVAPTALLCYVSMKFVTDSFETWFSEKVQVTIEKTREAGSYVYKQDQKRLESLARIALQRLDFLSTGGSFLNKNLVFNSKRLEGFDAEYGLSGVRIYNASGVEVWSNLKNPTESSLLKSSSFFIYEALKEFISDYKLKSKSTVVAQDQQDVVRGAAPIRDPVTSSLLGLIVTEVRFETQILKSVENILEDFAKLKPGAQLIRFSYMILMIVVTLLIIFSATWLGFYVAKEISGSLQSLSEATREIALGNYNVVLRARSDDETSHLVNAFNLMTNDLRENQRRMEETQLHLFETNRELDQRRRYMEIMLKNVSAGVVTVDADKIITSINSAAEKLLSKDAFEAIGVSVEDGLGKDLVELFWNPIYEGVNKDFYFEAQIDLTPLGKDIILRVDATRVRDENDIEVGYVIVFDDTKIQMMVQRAAAWREVARRIAHEIKNPITPIKLNAQRLLRRFNHHFGEEEQLIFDSCLKTIINQVDSLRDLVNEFSKFSRLPKINPKNADLMEVLTDVVKLFSMSYPNIQIQLSGDVKIPNLFLDTEQMNRVFVNILSNAVAAVSNVERKAKIIVGVYVLTHLNMVKISFSDNGIGIPQDIQNRVFEPYFSTKKEGTGLGLAIANQIIADHGGYLRIKNNLPYGAKVMIELPLGALKKSLV